MNRRLDTLRAYLRRRGFPAALPNAPAHPELGIVVVIPCHDEPDLLMTLESLRRCRSPRAAVEVVTVWNASERDGGALRRRHRMMVERVLAWRSRHEGPRLRVHALNYPRLPARHAGVGLARKIGMDEAVGRFVRAGNPRGIIASLDADCICDDDYLVALESHFARHPTTRACTVYFEHDLDGPLDEALYRGITRYELFLRYYRHGLAFAGFPFAHYTIGSCLAVRCEDYARHGGMNRRKAGEDFYFLNKLMAVGGVSELTATRVMPGVRPSARTPFGTGRALAAHMGDDATPWPTYDPRVFRDLKALVDDVDAYADIEEGAWRPRPGLSGVLNGFLVAGGIVEKHAEMRRNCASPASFRKRFFQWFDGFRALKFIHHATRSGYPRQPLERACRTLLGWQGADAGRLADARELLLYLRERDRHGAFLTRIKCPLDSQTV